MTLFTHTSTDTLHRLTQTPADKHIIAQIHTITERIRLSREDTQRLPPGAHSRSVVLVCNGGSAAVGRSGVGLPSSVPLLRPQLLPLTHAHSMSTLKCVCPFSVSIFSGGLQLHVFLNDLYLYFNGHVSRSLMKMSWIRSGHCPFTYISTTGNVPCQKLSHVLSVPALVYGSGGATLERAEQRFVKRTGYKIGGRARSFLWKLLSGAQSKNLTDWRYKKYLDHSGLGPI